MRRVVGVVTAAVAVAAGWSPAAPARAAAGGGSTVVVHGTDFPGSKAANLSFVGCQSLMGRTPETVQSYVGFGPANPPAGERSQGFDLAGGNAVGSLHYVESLAATTVASVSVIAPQGTTGVAYVGFQEAAQKGSTLMWFGRAPLTVGAGGWQNVNATALSYTWSVIDTRTGASLAYDPVLGATGLSTIGPFLAGHGGDGPAVFAVGFGCDGAEFNIDRFRIGGPAGVTTYDLEGLTTSLDISGSATSVEAGKPVTLTARLRDQAGERVPGAMVVLESRPAGAAQFHTEAVLPASAEDPSVRVKPEKDTVYRFRFADRPLAEGSVSAAYAVTVTEPGQEPSPEPTRGPKPSEEPKPSQGPSPSQDPSQVPSKGSETTSPGGPTGASTEQDGAGTSTEQDGAGTSPEPKDGTAGTTTEGASPAPEQAGGSSSDQLAPTPSASPAG